MMAIPHSIDAEHAVIGAIIRNGKLIDEVGTLKPDHFYAVENREIFRCMLDMSANGRDIDVITLSEWIEQKGKGVVTGGLFQLSTIAANTVGAAVGRYGEIVKDKAIERRILSAVGDIQGLIAGTGPTKDKLNAAQALIMSIHEQTQTKQPRLIAEALNDYVATLEQRHQGDIRGTPTGLSGLDDMLSGGMQDGNLVILAGRPSMGKSAFSNTVAINVARAGSTAAIMSMEMTETEQIDRVVATLGRVPLQSVLNANLAGDEGERIYTAVGMMADLPLVIDDEAGLSVHQVMSKARQIKRKHDLKLLVVDALGLMDFDSNRMVSELGQITKTLKGFAKEMNIPVMLLCQLSRKCEERPDKRPVMSDLRDSGNIEQDADVVIMLYRDEYYNPDTHDKGIAECLIRKNRQGKCGTVPLVFLGDQTRFENLAGEWHRPEPTKRSRKGFDA